MGNWKRVFPGGRDQGRPVLAFEVSLQRRAGFGPGCGQKSEQDIRSQAGVVVVVGTLASSLHVNEVAPEAMQGRKQVKDRLRHHLPVRALRGRAENRKTLGECVGPDAFRKSGQLRQML